MTTHSKTVVVTGVASGIGKATALNFAAQGCAVIGADLQYSDENRARLETAGVT